MNDPKFTPGPWPQDYVYTAIRHIVRNCDISSEEQPEFSWSKYDDSPLIGAAPELYAALREMVAMMDSGDEPGEGSPWHQTAKAALAKATP